MHGVHRSIEANRDSICLSLRGRAVVHAWSADHTYWGDRVVVRAAGKSTTTRRSWPRPTTRLTRTLASCRSGLPLPPSINHGGGRRRGVRTGKHAAWAGTQVMEEEKTRLLAALVDKDVDLGKANDTKQRLEQQLTHERGAHKVTAERLALAESSKEELLK
jgi:hypothetical protein